MLILLVLGIRYLLQRRKAAAAAASSAPPGEASAAASASRIDARNLSSMNEARQTFLEGLSLASRLRFRFYRPIVVLGDSADGKSAVISHYLDWQGQAARFNPPYTDHPLVQFYLGSSLVVYELSAVLLQEHSKEVARTLDRFFREVFRIHRPEVVIALRVDEHMEQQLPRLIPLAQALRGRLDTLSRRHRNPVKVRLALTHLDQVDGFLSLRRFLDAAQLPMSIPLAPLLRPEGVATCLDPYNDYLNLALRDCSGPEFEAVLTCLELLPKRLGWLPAFLQELARPELASLEPELDHLYLCAVGAASTPETAVSSQGVEIGNPFRAASMLDVVAALSRSNKRHRHLALSVFAVGAILLLLMAGIKRERLSYVQSQLDEVDGAELGMSRQAFSQLVRSPAKEAAQEGFGLARISAKSTRPQQDPTSSTPENEAPMLIRAERDQARERLSRCATGKKADADGQQVPAQVLPSFMSQELRTACQAETDQGFQRPLFVRQGAQEAQLLEAGRVLRAVDTIDSLLWLPRFFHVELKAEATYRFERAIRQQFLLKGLREGAELNALGQIYYALGLLYPSWDAKNKGTQNPFGFELDSQHWADALGMPSELVEDYGAFMKRPWQCPLDARYWKLIEASIRAVDAQHDALKTERALQTMASTGPGKPGRAPASSRQLSPQENRGRSVAQSDSAQIQGRLAEGSTSALPAAELDALDSDSDHGAHDFGTLQGWSSFLNDMRQLWRKGTPRAAHFERAQHEAEQALVELAKLRRFELQGEVYPNLPHEVRFCMPPPEQSMAEVERWTNQQQGPLLALLRMITQTALLPEYQSGMTLMELRRVLTMPQVLPKESAPRTELQLENQRLVFEAERWKTFATRVRNLSLIERFLKERALDADSYVFFSLQARYQPEELWQCETSQSPTAPGCVDFQRCELDGKYTSAAFFDAMRALEQFDAWLDGLLLERPTKERVRSLVDSEARLYFSDYQQALFCYYQDFQVGTLSLSEQLAELSRPASSLTSMLEDVAQHGDTTLPAPEWSAFVEGIARESRESSQSDSNASNEDAEGVPSPLAAAEGQAGPQTPPMEKTAAGATAGAAAAASAVSTPASASQADERSTFLRPLEVFLPVRDAMAGEQGEHPRMANFHRLMASLASELAQEEVQAQSLMVPSVPLNDLAVGLEQYVPVSARYALKDLRGEPVEPRITLNTWLQELRLDQDARLSLPFRRPIDALLEHGRQELIGYLNTIWQQGLWPQLRERARYQPFSPTSTVPLEPEELSPWLSPTGTFWEQTERLVGPVLLKRPDGQYVVRSWSSRARLLPACMLERLNQLVRARAQLWDEKGAARPLSVQVEALPLPDRVEELAPVSVTLRVGSTTVLAFNQRPVETTLSVPWDEPYSVSLEVRALKLSMVDDRNRRSEVKRLNDAPEVFGALVVPPSPWAFQELLTQGDVDERHRVTWTVWVGRKPVPVTFQVRPDPYAALVRSVQKECGDGL